jgi:hypothetical protein
VSLVLQLTLYYKDATMTRKYKKPEAESGEIFSLRLPAELVQLIDDWRRDEPDLPVRSEAIRRMVRLESERRKAKKK